MTRWDTLFEPVSSKGSIKDRPQQRLLGNAIIDTLESNGALLAEATTGTGKSLAYLTPAIARVKDHKRTVVSTETTALQDQLVEKDLPFLHSVYGNFKYRALKGRSWYLCLNRMRVSVIGSKDLKKIYDVLEKTPRGALRDGQRADVIRVLGAPVSADTWDEICGTAEFCADNSCSTEKCWSTRARALAIEADIVVTNHAMLRTDADMRMMSNISLLGDIETLVIDEAHTLEAVLIDGWTRELMPWDVWSAAGTINDGISRASSVVETGNSAGNVTQVFETIETVLHDVTEYFTRLSEYRNDHPQPWKRESLALCEYSLSGMPSSSLIRCMEKYESTVATRLTESAEVLRHVSKLLDQAVQQMLDQTISGVRKVRKGARIAREMSEMFSLMAVSVKTHDGIVEWAGAPYGVVAHGMELRRTGKTIGVKVVPLDVSARVRGCLWNVAKSKVLVSATLADPTTGDMRYTRMSLGLDSCSELITDSPFKFSNQQLVYITPGEMPVIPLHGARYSIEELVAVIEASQGRTLVLFTSNEEMRFAATELRQLRAEGTFAHELYVQEPGVDKQVLVEAFRRDESSVLLGSKSFMTGVDFPGRTCSTVVLAKFPLPQYNTLCKMKISWWRRRGFPLWYEREALLVFAQAIGRLIRSETDSGVIALLDQRGADPRSKISNTMSLGISKTGSRVTQQLTDVKEFLSA